MKVTVGSYFHTPERESQREFHITLTEEDGEELFPDEWSKLTFSERYKKLRAMGDIFTLSWAASRGIRSEKICAEEIQDIMAKDLS